jgi:dTDP-glucose 4,6-dehydratase
MENIVIVGMILDILDEISPRTGGGSRRDLITYVQDRPGHDRRYAIDFSKLRQALGWQPRESFLTGLRKTVAWYVENRAWADRVRSGEYQKWIDEQYGG